MPSGQIDEIAPGVMTEENDDMEDLVDGADTVVDEDAADVRAIVWDERIKIVAGGSDDDDDDDDDQGDDGHDDTGEDDHDLSNQDPDSDD